MAEFTDTANAADNTGFSDSLGDATTSTPQGIPDSTATTNTGDSPPTPPDTTGTDTAITGDTATPTDSTQDSTGDAVSNTPEEQDIYILVTTVTNRTAGIPNASIGNRPDSYKRQAKNNAFLFRS